MTKTDIAEDGGGSADEGILTRICQDMVAWENEGQSARARFEDILSDNLCFRRANGETVGKRDFLEALGGNAQPDERWVEGGVEVRLLGAVAVASLRVGLAPRGLEGHERREQGSLFRNIRIFLRGEGGGVWKLHMWFNVAIPPAS